MEKRDQVTLSLKSRHFNDCVANHIFRDSSHDGGKEGHRSGADSAEAVNIILTKSTDSGSFDPNNIFIAR